VRLVEQPAEADGRVGVDEAGREPATAAFEDLVAVGNFGGGGRARRLRSCRRGRAATPFFNARGDRNGFCGCSWFRISVLLQNNKSLFSKILISTLNYNIKVISSLSSYFRRLILNNLLQKFAEISNGPNK
jgi:hypothetical protein